MKCKKMSKKKLIKKNVKKENSIHQGTQDLYNRYKKVLLERDTTLK